MKYILAVSALLLFGCASIDPVYYSNGTETTINFIIIENSASSMQTLKGKLDTKYQKLLAGYQSGYKFQYEKNGAVHLIINTVVKNGSKNNQNHSTIIISGKSYESIKGSFKYRIPDFPKKVKVSKQISIKRPDRASSLYDSLITTAVKKYAKPGQNGIIYPIGDVEYKLSVNGVTLKSYFIIHIN